MKQNKSTSQFFDWCTEWKNMALVVFVEAVILIGSVLFAYCLYRYFKFSFFLIFVSFYLLMVLWTLLVLKIIRSLFAFKPGIYTYTANPLVLKMWNLYQFLCLTNLNLFYSNSLIPLSFKTGFYKLLGTKIGKGSVRIMGQISDPHFVVIEGNVLIGNEAFLLPHLFTLSSSTTSVVLILGTIEIQNNAVVGTKAVILPGVTVGENSMVNAMSLVAMNTKIPPNEIWGGNPAKKVGDVPKV